ncbi:MAG: UDP-N-acetylmuramate--L-alanine ligase [Micavibrio sp.]|nr:MAG: UDP-N-acetylmuramate--L-alanine ligase [Micavibrio sp.]
MKNWPLETGVLHFTGIGGIGMSGIAEILHRLGYKIQGSDIKDSANAERLRDQGIKVFIGHDGDYIKKPESGGIIDAVIYSSAIKPDNPELVAAEDRGIPVIRRAEMLGELMRFKNSIAVAGTHGKTTTTSLVGHVMEQAGLDPTVVNGGIVNAYGTNIRIGESDWMVVETDESDGSFTLLPSSIGIITNIDPEHMDHYGSFAEVKEAYKKFAARLPFYGFLIACADSDAVKKLIEDVRRKTFTYGFSEGSDIRATNLRNTADGMVFDVSLNGGEKPLNDVLLPMFGRHNVLNALACIAVCHKIGVSGESIRTALGSFTGVKRRFTTTGVVNGIRIIDDYAHHPEEIKAVLGTARDILRRESKGGRVIAVMQPHRYSRLAGLFDDFCRSFDAADHVLVADVYTAGEQPIAGADKNTLVQGIRKTGHKSAEALVGPQDVPRLVRKIAKEHDLVIFLGAGDVTNWAYALPSQLADPEDRKDDTSEKLADAV